MSEAAELLPISVVLPAYCAETQLAQAVRSVRAQDRAPAEIIVVDDASPDRTAEVAAELGARVVRLTKNRGAAGARNAGVAAASQPWVAFLDHDDVWLEGKLAAQWEAICRWPEAGLCFTDYDALYANGHVVPRETAADFAYASMTPSARAGSAALFSSDAMVHGLVRSMFVRQSSVIVNRDLFRACGGYDERLRLAEDYDLLLRLSASAPAIAVERSLVAYCRRDDSLSADPLAEISSIDRLWTLVLERPGHYPEAALAAIRESHADVLRRGALTGVRLGRFREAATFARRALRLRRSAAAVVLLCAARVLDTPTGSALHRRLRSAWQLRRGRPASALNPLESR